MSEAAYYDHGGECAGEADWFNCGVVPDTLLGTVQWLVTPGASLFPVSSASRSNPRPEPTDPPPPDPGAQEPHGPHTPRPDPGAQEPHGPHQPRPDPGAQEPHGPSQPRPDPGAQEPHGPSVGRRGTLQRVVVTPGFSVSVATRDSSGPSFVTGGLLSNT